jgi:DNA-binding transcriptional LysR family regulator
MAELRQLRYFLAAAERLSFSEAALDLSLSQPALSESIRKLEDELGAPLFVRAGRRVTLTPAGETLQAEAGPLVAGVEAALQRTRDVAHGRTGRLRVGFEAAGAGRLSTLSRARFARRHPEIRVEPRRFEWGGEVAALRDGECDVAFVWLPADGTNLHLEIVAEEERYAGLSATHPLARHDQLAIADLADEPIMWTRRAPRPWVDWWAVNPRPGGREPVWGPENDNVEEMLEQVAEGVAMCIVPRSMTEYYARPDLVWRPITDIDPLRIALGWREPQPAVLAFADIVRELAGRAGAA